MRRALAGRVVVDITADCLDLAELLAVARGDDKLLVRAFLDGEVSVEAVLDGEVDGEGQLTIIYGDTHTSAAGCK